MDHEEEELRRRWLDGLRSPRTREAYARDLASFTAWSRDRDRSVLDADEAEDLVGLGRVQGAGQDQPLMSGAGVADHGVEAVDHLAAVGRQRLGRGLRRTLVAARDDPRSTASAAMPACLMASVTASVTSGP